ncbi:type II toxin-antitoxin system VapB family antitoxin [Aureimonas psammosilenae]|uniref:type II toxin-antitoxin system VapB family antitoxin n=1 Tax=Aureimonas psammosilenae TaxID=2495496 RepID=UPI001260ABB5|nr:type II toxin-antitoxin system VapB family antitoxin [Aureimonas psammosilenae]
MGVNVIIDESLLAQAMDTTGLGSDSATVEEGLRLLIENNSRRQALKELWGIGWEGDLDAMRTDIDDSDIR